MIQSREGCEWLRVSDLRGFLSRVMNLLMFFLDIKSRINLL